MASRYGWPIVLSLVAFATVSTPAVPGARQTRPEHLRKADFDIRDTQPAAPSRLTPRASSRGGAPQRDRLNRESGSLRVLEQSGLTIDPRSQSFAISRWLASEAQRLGLTAADLGSLALVRDYTTRATGVRHLLFRQVLDGNPVFDSAVAIHVAANGRVLRITSNAAPGDGRNAVPTLAAATAALAAGQHGDGTPGTPELVWLPVAGALRLAWHVVVTADEDVADVLVDAQSSELLIRRSRSRDAQAIGRIFQSADTAAASPGQPDPMPLGDGATPGCPPPTNYELRRLDTPFLDPATVVASSGRLEGNNVQIFRGAGGASASGTPTADGWLFDFPLNSAGSAETSLFFGANFVHDFFYDLGFDEAAGNFQADNFSRGGVGGDPLHLNARAPGRNNANYTHTPDGTSPTINMFLWDGAGCWGADADGDGSVDLEGDYDLDILVHEFHHGVSLRLNTAFTGNEAGAIGEGGGDFFAYSVNNDPVLAEFSRPGGLRAVNGKGYGDWSCLLGLFCEVHDNGEIWANVLWDVRERFRADAVNGSPAAATAETHQLYVDALALSPPAPTMLDMRDAMLLADAMRNPAGSSSANFCRLWESFAGRGMGVTALDTADSGLNQVTAAYDVPAGCVAPPGPPVVSITTAVATANEAGATPASVTIRRNAVSNRALTIAMFVGGSAASGVDYAALTPVIIPAGAAETTLSVVPIDDVLLEGNETVTITLRAATGYIVGTPSIATVTITSDDVAPDLTVSALTAPAKAAPGGTIAVTDTTRNQGTGAGPASQTYFYLSRDVFLDGADSLVGSRPVEALAVGAVSTATASVTLPGDLGTGTYFLFAKADGPAEVTEVNETNNHRASAISIGPDLLVTSFTAPAAASPGSAINVSDTTTNQGSAPAPPSITSFYLSSNVVFDASDVLLGSRPLAALAAGGTSTAGTTVTLPATLATGTYYLIARADGGAAIAELNEMNNGKASAIRIGPDLVVSSFSAPIRAAAGGTIAVTETTANSGTGPAAASTTAFYLSLNLTVDSGDVRLGPGRPVPPLAPGQSSTATTPLTLPDVAAGVWYVLAYADDAGAVAETQETNNVRFASVLIGPDLMFGFASSPSAAVAGSTITASTTVRNAGAALAAATTIRFYLSTNVSLDASDVVLNASQGVPMLAADGSFASTTQIVLPSDKVGTFYLLMIADADQVVAETSEGNNLAARLLTLSGR
jgi:subtilase family serine protease